MKNAKRSILSHIKFATLAVMLVTPYVEAAPIFIPANQPIGYVAQPVVSNQTLATTGGYLYRGEYDKGNWSGNLSCYPIDTTGSPNTNTPCWSVTGVGTAASTTVGAASKVDLMPFTGTGGRLIGTLKDDPGASRIPFQWINLSTSTAYNTALGSQAVVDYLRGDRSQESPAGAMRNRSTVLGDTIHSRPNYWTEANGANPTVFYGGNDGMLHAIDASSGSTGGSERWAYVPSMLVPKLKKLSVAGYTHDYYVDGNTYIAGISTPAGGTMTVITGALGAGGKGLYALDISSVIATSDQNVANKILWEITPTSLVNVTRTNFNCVAGAAAPLGSYCNLGDAYSNPILTKANTGQDVVIVGNGYNNTGSGTATLYIINAIDGKLIREIDTGVAGVSGPNGLSSPVTVDSNGDGKADAVYAGDIDGNMWKFDISSTSSSSWTKTLIYTTSPKQAITSSPDVAQHPNGGYIVDFATGRMLTVADQTDISTFYVYGIWDGAPASNTTLQTQTITERNYIPTAGATSTFRVRNATANTLNWSAGGHKGWSVALPQSNGKGGERVVGDNVTIANNHFYFNATNPNVVYTPSGLATNSGTGENWIMELNYLTGGSPNNPPANPNKPFLDLDGNGIFDDADRIKYTSGVDTLPNTNPATTYGMPILTSLGLPVGYMTNNGVESHPLVAVIGTFTTTYYNQNPDLYVAPTVPPNAVGIGNGHFDVDMFRNFGSTTSPNYDTQSHSHEYDKIYDVNGLNFLNSNVPNKLDLSLAVTSATTPYKVLMFNQSWSRAMLLKVGKTIWGTKDYQTGTPNASGSYNAGFTLAALSTPGATGVGALKMSSVPTYTGNNSTTLTTSKDPVTGKVTVLTVSTPGTIGCGGAITAGCTQAGSSGLRDEVGGLELSMPYDAFSIKDWWGDGVQQTGVMPTFYACSDGSATSTGKEPANKLSSNPKLYYTGPLGERNDGVATVQIVRDTTPDADVQMNVPGRPDLGFRVMDSKIITDVYAEFTIHWHHPMNECYGDTTTTWKSTNNSGDPWWPAMVDSNNNWLSTTNKKGWTILPPPDVSTTPMPTVKYQTAADDPRTASFIKACGGAGQAACSACGSVGQPACTTCGGAGQPACSTCGGVGQPVCPPPSAFINPVGGVGMMVGAGCGGVGQPACVKKMACGGAGQPACDSSGACGGAGQPACQCGGVNQPACAPTGCGSCGGVGQTACLAGGICCGGNLEPACGGCPVGYTCSGDNPPLRTKRLSWHELINQ